MRFVIRYQMEFEDAALALARRLFAQFDEAIESLALAPADDEAFSLTLNGIVVHSQSATGRAPRVSDARAALPGL